MFILFPSRPILPSDSERHTKQTSVVSLSICARKLNPSETKTPTDLFAWLSILHLGLLQETNQEALDLSRSE